jgi:predicted transcriptional regulator of viral defense system
MVVRYLGAQGIARPRDLAVDGVSREHFRRLAAKGRIVRLARGMYALAEAELGEHESLVAACKAVPHGVICLLSALRFHGLTTQAPFDVWMALPRASRVPSGGGVPIRFAWFSGAALTEGVETHRVEGALVRVYGVEKTIADCFKYRNKIGLDVALEALRDAWRLRKGTADELWRFARVCRVGNVMRPYLEGLA